MMKSRATKPPEPAEAIFPLIIAGGLLTSALLISKGRKPITAVAREHRLVTTALFWHLQSWVPAPWYLDPIGWAGHVATMAMRRGNVARQG